METTLATAPLTGDFSIVGLFLAAAPVVKGVIVILLLASIGCWTIIIDKMVRLHRAGRDAGHFDLVARSAPAGGQTAVDGLSGTIVAAGMREWRDHSDASESRADRRQRIERAMRAAMAGALRHLEPGLSFLATVGSTAPFIGLFGTVWGIMNSFAAIAVSHDTSLAVVAPGIAEALFATALGLVAAIPAVIAYNRFSGQLARLAQRLNASIGELGAQLSRPASPAAVRSPRLPAEAGE